jgi:integrase
MEDKIDIHNVSLRYEVALRNFELDNQANERNRDLIIKFLWDCKVGKTIKGRAKKKISEPRLLKYLYLLKKLSYWLGQPFDEVKQKDMEKLVTNIEDDVYKNGNRNLSEETKLDYKKTLKKFYKWLEMPSLVEFMDMSFTPKDVPTITREEAEEKLVNSTPELGLKAVIIVLFDGGLRAAELLNLRLRDVTRKTYQSNQQCYFVNVRHSKTFGRTIPLPLCNKYLKEWIEGHPHKSNLESQLFPYPYKWLSRKIISLGKKVLKKRVTLHMLRHSSATYWAPKMNRYQLCAKYGWAFSSDMPDRYIKRKGIIFDQIAEKGDVDQTTKLQKENRDLNEKMDRLEQEYKKVRRALEFIMPVFMEKIDEKDFKNKLIEKRKEQLIVKR